MELRLKEIIKEKGVSLVSLYEKTGIEKGNLSNIINNKKNPTIETLEKIANALEIPVYEMFIDKASMTIFRCPCCGAELQLVEKKEE
jgi:transcriptional regulator with XRE-family HTH domain